MDDDEPGVDHIDAVLKSDSDNFVLGKVRRDGGEAFANLVRLVCLDHSNDGVSKR